MAGVFVKREVSYKGRQASKVIVTTQCEKHRGWGW